MLKALLNKTGPLIFNRSFVDSLFSSGSALHLAIVLVLLVADFYFGLSALADSISATLTPSPAHRHW